MFCSSKGLDELGHFCCLPFEEEKNRLMSTISDLEICKKQQVYSEKKPIYIRLT